MACLCLKQTGSAAGVGSSDGPLSGMWQGVTPREAASVSSAETALCSCAELCMLGTAAAYSSVASFGMLVNLSVAAVIGAWTVYSTWVFGFNAKSRLQGTLDPKAA